MNRSRTALITAALGVSIAVAGCGSDSGGGGLDPVAKAADATRNAKSAQVQLTGIVRTAGKQIQITGEGVMSTRDDANARMAITANSGGKRQTIQEIFDNGVMYMGGEPLAKQIPFGKKWMRIDLQKLFEKHGADMTQFDQGGGSATKMLDYLGGAGDVKKVGSQRVRGVPTTHYHAVVDLEKAAEKAGDKEIQAFIKQSQSGVSSIPSDVWIDRQDRIRRYRMELPMGEARSVITMDFTRFGVVLNNDPPPDDQVFDATGLVEKQIEQAAG